jgi:DNA-directed RNA polymerase sigma subunit (sigma70/sigma32)
MTPATILRAAGFSEQAIKVFELREIQQKTLQATATAIGLKSRERVRQINASTWRKLRHSRYKEARKLLEIDCSIKDPWQRK